MYGGRREQYLQDPRVDETNAPSVARIFVPLTKGNSIGK